jgi:ribosomal protein S18 acetylase RimI-like enzyme
MEQLLDRLSDPDVRELLALALGAPTAEAVEQTANRYANHEDWLLFGVERDGRVAGLVGFELLSDRHARIHHIAVAPSYRRNGLARALVSDLVRRLELLLVSAETDDDAVGFYARCGFAIGVAAPRLGTRRYECELRP